MNNDLDKIMDELHNTLELQIRKAQERKVIDTIIDIYNGKYENYKEYHEAVETATTPTKGNRSIVIYFLPEDIFNYIVSKRNNK